MTKRKESDTTASVDQTVSAEAPVDQMESPVDQAEETPEEAVPFEEEETIEEEVPVDQAEETTEEAMPVEQAKAVKKLASTPAQRVTDALTKVARNLLACNPSLKVVYMTADGSGFRTRNDADNHARNLKSKAVTPVNR